MHNHEPATILNDLVREIWGGNKTFLNKRTEGKWHKKIEGRTVLTYDFAFNFQTFFGEKYQWHYLLLDSSVKACCIVEELPTGF